MDRNEIITNDGSSIVLYTSEDGQTELQVKMEQETVWLSVNQMAILFDREESNIRRHVGNVFKEGELVRESNVHFLHVPNSHKPVVAKFATSKKFGSVSEKIAHTNDEGCDGQGGGKPYQSGE